MITIDVVPAIPVESAVPESPEAPSEPPATTRPDQAGPPETGNQGPMTLPQAVETGLAVYEPARISLEESELAMMKVREARRNLFPGASLRGTYTTGTASEVAFRETQAGLQVEHPLYDSGRLRDSYKQSLVNLQVSQKRYEKIRADFSFEIAQAYFDLIAARQAVAFREWLLGEAQQIFEKTQQRFKAGFVTPLELLNVQSQLSQATFQLGGARNDVAVAELKFRHRMNLDAALELEIPIQFPVSEATVALDDALRIATTTRPDVQINTLLVEFHKYEERLAKKKESWKLDLTGFVGASGGAFESESLTLDRDYSVALKASRPWGGSASSITATKVETSPRLGQTSRTGSNSLQGEFGILNALAAKSEIEQASIGRLKAQNDLAETRHVLEQEVHEAYYAFEKAQLTLEHARQREAFRAEQVKILKAQAELNEALPSQVLEALLQLSDDQVSQVQAKASYHIALARLSKAIGVTGYYQ